MYIKIIDNKIVYPATNKEIENGTIFNYSQNEILLIADGYHKASDAELLLIEKFNKGEAAIEGNELVDITGRQSYKDKKRLIAIEDELCKADSDYATVLSTPVTYPANGLTYKPSYVDSYALLIVSGMGPFTIWDSTEFNGTLMTSAELTGLAIFLKSIAEPAFQTRKDIRKKLLTEKEELIRKE